MSELIDRQALENGLRTECYGTDTYDDKEYVIGRLREELPTIPAPRWVRCEEELPKDNTWCVFISENKHNFEQYRWIGTYSEEWGFQDDDNFMVDNVKYWMPLPEPPQEDA